MFANLQISQVWSIAKKEILTTLRDRRAMLTATLIPLLLLPLLALVMPIAASFVMPALKLDKTRVGIEGTLPEELRKALVGGLISTIKLESVAKASAAKEVAVAIVVPSSLPQAIGDASAELVLYQHSSNKRASAAILAIEAGVSRYNERLASIKLSALGLDKTQLKPLKTRIELSKGGFALNIVGTLLPLMLIIWCTVGGQASAIEATVAERERGTLEALLGAPITRADAVLGKFISVTFFGLISGICGLLGIALTVLCSTWAIKSFLGALSTKAIAAMSLALGLNVEVSLLGGLAIVSTTLNLASVMCALVLLPCVFARSYKEAQFYIAPSVMIGVGAAMAANFAEFFAGSVFSCLPITGAVAVIGDAFVGKISASAWLLANVSNLVLTAVLLLICTYFMRREAVIFRGS
jgi:sodium transport system permease protein